MLTLFVAVVLSSGLIPGCDGGSNPGPGAATAEGTSRPVTGGTPTGGDPAVVAIVFADDLTALRCTGTVVSERVVLTAAHCGVQWDSDNDAEIEQLVDAIIAAAYARVDRANVEMGL